MPAADVGPGGWDALPRRAANQAGPAPEFPWPGGRRAAMFLSVDVDAETAWTSKDPAHAARKIRPPLVFAPDHVGIFLDAFEGGLTEVTARPA